MGYPLYSNMNVFFFHLIRAFFVHYSIFAWYDSFMNYYLADIEGRTKVILMFLTHQS